MPKDNENIRLPVAGPLESAEPQGFAPEQMIRCEECLRANPPTRINCLYCNVLLPVTESSARLRKPILRPLEKHESGYNTIVLPGSDNLSAEVLEDASSFLRLKREDLERILTEGVALPVARTASREEAELIADRLQAWGVRVVTLTEQVRKEATLPLFASGGAASFLTALSEDQAPNACETISLCSFWWTLYDPVAGLADASRPT